MRPGIKAYTPADPWLNVHENFKNHFTPGKSWTIDHSSDTGLSDGDLYKRATENMKWLIGDAIDNRYTLRAMGANWSFAPVAMCTGGLLQTKGMDLIFNIKDSHVVPAYTAGGKTAAGLKFVECGVQMARLNRFLEIELNPARSIKASGGSNGQTVAGATSTGTHGAALYTGAVHDSIVGIHLVTGRDTHVWLERASYPVASDAFINFLGATPKRDDELFNAALVGIGAFGIVHGVMMETDPLYLLKEYRFEHFTYSDELMQALATLDIAKLRTLLTGMPDSVPGHELYHMEINMNPYTTKKGGKGGMYIFMFYKVPVPPGFVVDQSGNSAPAPSPEFIFMMRDLLTVLGGGKLGYEIVKKATSSEFEKNIRPATPEPRTIGSIFRDTRFTGNIASFAVAIPTSDLPKALEQILAEIAVNAFAGAVAVRFVKGTKATLGFTKFEHTCVVEMDGVDSAPNHKIFGNIVKRLEDNNIPCAIHWGKLNEVLTAKRVVNMYGTDKLNSWKKSRETLLKPETRAVFTNNFMSNLKLDTPVGTIV